MTTEKSAATSDRRFLVYTCAGDRANLHNWLTPHRSFDLWINYYGDRGEPYKDVADIYTLGKGTKFPNLLRAFQEQPDILQRYDAVFMMDDDILISGDNIDRLFRVREELGLWLLQPAFSPLGRISYPITRVQRAMRYRHVSFVEETCPLFQRDKLEDFLRIYNPALRGHGIDWWFLHNLGENRVGKVAVIDEIPCINPFSVTKKGWGREWSLLSQTDEEKTRVWEEVEALREVPRGRKYVVEYSAVAKTGFGLVTGYLQSYADFIFLVLPNILYTKLKVWAVHQLRTRLQN